ncbi:MAG TPA: DNA-processing protein DprA [Firmicutes bacterium]|nr:DNA-processing protein DprA [Bacillales bacterium]HJA40924.1 DNA-processing protein DprA [Bacillota bacterium]
MRERLIYYHYKSQGNRQAFYAEILQDQEILYALYALSLQMPKKCLYQTSCESVKKMSKNFILPEDLRKEMQIITIFDKAYPVSLKNIYDPPLVLYAKGDIRLLQNICISVIGTRTPSKNAYFVLQKMVSPLIDSKFCIVSGLANGIDTYAHLFTMEKKGMTIAVLGSGFNYIYPKSNSRLANQIASSQLLLTEYPPYVRPQKWRFVERNRIIAGLSIATVVIEARAKSGTLITAQLALEEGREIFAVPGSVFNENSVGCHRLIQEGANLVCDGYDILKICKQML